MSTPDRLPIKEAALIFLESYADAMHISSSTNFDCKSHAQITHLAEALAAHYNPNGTTCFTLGSRPDLPPAQLDALLSHLRAPSKGEVLSGVFPGHGAAAEQPIITASAGHLQNFVRTKLGLHIQAWNLKVKPVSDTAAVCFIAWRITPSDEADMEGWSWQNVYVYQRGVAGATGLTGPPSGVVDIGDGDGESWKKTEGWWEYIVSDGEIEGLMTRVPGFFEGQREM